MQALQFFAMFLHSYTFTAEFDLAAPHWVFESAPMSDTRSSEVGGGNFVQPTNPKNAELGHSAQQTLLYPSSSNLVSSNEDFIDRVNKWTERMSGTALK